MTTEEVIQMRIRSIQREIDDLERTKAEKNCNLAW